MKPSIVLFSRTKAVVIIVAGCLALSQLSCTKEGPAGPAGAQGAPGSTGTPDDLTNPNIMPEVIFTLPGNNTTGPFSLYTPADVTTKPHFVLRFNKYMLKSSVSSRSLRCVGFDRPVAVRLFTPYIRILPEHPSGVSSEFYDNILEFTIDDSSYSYDSGRMPYRVGRTYIIVVDTLMEDINGNHPRQQYQFSYRPEPYFRVVNMSPENGSTTAGQSLNATVVFNTLLDASILSSVQFIPITVGQWSVYRYDSTSVVYQTGAQLPFNTPCVLTVLSTARDRYGNQINVGYSSSFSITPFQVDRWYPTAEDGGVSSLSDIYVYFTGPLDYTTVSQGWSITPSIAGSLNGHYTNSAIWFRPTSGFVPGTTYSVVLSTSIRAVDGTALRSPFVFSFTTAPFRCIYSTPSYGSPNVSITNPMYFSFNAGLDTSTVRSSLSISPQVGFEYSVNNDATSLTVTPASYLINNRTYTVTLSTGLRCKAGAHLESPYVLVFTTIW